MHAEPEMRGQGDWESRRRSLSFRLYVLHAFGLLQYRGIDDVRNAMNPVPNMPGESTADSREFAELE